jgi:hypothetical protein
MHNKHTYCSFHVFHIEPYSISDMSLLGFLEEKLGTVTAWPTHVLRLLFAEALSALKITALAAFFNGNPGPLNAALSFYLLCTDNEHDIVGIVTECYDEWDATPIPHGR